MGKITPHKHVSHPATPARAGKAEVPLQHIADPVEILHRQRPIEPQLGADLRQHLWVTTLLAGHHQRGIARHELLQAEHQDADQQQRRDDLRDARAEVPAHYFASSMPWMRIMPSGTGRKPLSLADIATMLRGLYR